MPTTATVNTVQTGDFEPVFRMEAFGADDIAVSPTHPPIDQIQPLPMPNPEWDVPDHIGGPGNAVYHDHATGQTFETPVTSLGLTDGGFGGPSFVGADGFDSLADLYGPRGFGTMFALNDATISTHPFRMNVKLVQQYIDSGTGASSY
ncbi:MAG: hypothetical protein K8E66_14270, partial [Phycisphaerales bacterium]|nr:hypothetical protein [Phycisphaerales bacterium]